MNREFLDLYNRELDLFYEQAAEFAEEFPGIAGRLGSLVKERTDPMVAGLLEGAAFLAARVQLKLKHEFPEFTNNLVEQLVPHYLAPTPSAMLVHVQPNYGDAGLRDGRVIPRGAALDAMYSQAGRKIACKFRLTAPVTLLPFEIAGAQYFPSAGPIQALGVPVGPNVLAGLKLSLTHRMAPNVEDEVKDEQARKMPEVWFAGCRVAELPVTLAAADADADALYEQVLAHCAGVYFRHADDFGDPVVSQAQAGCIGQIGFAEADGLMPNDNRIFSGFDLLREYFLFPRKFLGFSITGLASAMPRLKAKNIDIIFTFDEVNTRLAAAVQPQMFSLYAAPAINLFEMTTDRVPVKSNQHEYQVIPDKSRALDFEPHRILEVYAHYTGGAAKIPVRPLYSAASEGGSAKTLVYTLRRLPRLATMEEKKYGQASSYTGTDIYLSLGEGAQLGDLSNVAELSVRALCSNRHLTEQLPVGTGQSDFRLVDNVALDVKCIAGPTPPREPVIKQMRSRAENASTGVVTWRLINMLSLNHLGLVAHGAGKNAEALREVLSMFADLADSATERRIRGIKSVESRPVVRRIRQLSGIGAARGLEITVTMDDKAFEGSGVFLLGAVLDRFFCEYSAFNHFTQTVIRTSERGEIMRWPVRTGRRRPL